MEAWGGRPQGMGRETGSGSWYSHHLKRTGDGFENSFHAKLVSRETAGIFLEDCPYRVVLK